MNIFEKYKPIIVTSIKKYQNDLNISNLSELNGVTVESPPVEFDYDISCNVCLILAKKNKLNPKLLAEKLQAVLLKDIVDFSAINIAGPGFLNIKLSKKCIQNIIKDIFASNKNYGSNKDTKKYNLEFVSANPTGPMHVGHCRGAIYGDVLGNLLKFNGNKVIKEYYINDYGNQIVNFCKSVFLRIREIKYNEAFQDSPNLYPGIYIKDFAKKIIEKNPKNLFENFKKSYDLISTQALDSSMDLIKDDLKRLGIVHDYFFSESELIKKDLVTKSIDQLKKDKLVIEGYLNPPKGEENKDWKKSKRLIFKSTLFGDDSDRALQKDDGSWTYFANDIAYHSDKVSRNYDVLINVLGADHTGYIKRISAAVKALSKGKTELQCRVCQLVKLYKDNQPFKMSKRAGDFISAKDLLNEVSKDSIRFMMLNRSNDVELDFDFNKVLEKSKENPVYYVQYCYARINSLFRSLQLKIDAPVELDLDNFNLNDYENKILRKILDWPKVIDIASKKYEPHRLPFYLYDLATLFHSYWSKGNIDESYRFLSNGKIKNINTLAIIKLVSITIKNGMDILGVSLPEKM